MKKIPARKLARLARHFLSNLPPTSYIHNDCDLFLGTLGIFTTRATHDHAHRIFNRLERIRHKQILRSNSHLNLNLDLTF
jgi:hypothetical protein